LLDESNQAEFPLAHWVDYFPFGILEVQQSVAVEAAGLGDVSDNWVEGRIVLLDLIVNDVIIIFEIIIPPGQKLKEANEHLECCRIPSFGLKIKIYGEIQQSKREAWVS
jgi:hypothetical protein